MFSLPQETWGSTMMWLVECRPQGWTSCVPIPAGGLCPAVLEDFLLYFWVFSPLISILKLLLLVYWIFWINPPVFFFFILCSMFLSVILISGKFLNLTCSAFLLYWFYIFNFKVPSCSMVFGNSTVPVLCTQLSSFCDNTVLWSFLQLSVPSEFPLFLYIWASVVLEAFLKSLLILGCPVILKWDNKALSVQSLIFGSITR